MEYTYLPVESTTSMELKAGQFTFILDTTIPIYDKMLLEFQDASNIERFIALLEEDANTAFTIYNEA